MKLIIEFIGTILLTDLYICATANTDYLGFVMGVFILLAFGFKISGAHYNPSITVAYMLRKHSGARFSNRVLGVAYIIFQFGGGIIGAFLALLLQQSGGEVELRSRAFTFEGMLSEALGSFFLVFLYLTQTEEETKLSKDPVITILIIASSYLAFLLMMSPPDQVIACLNPAIALGSSLSMYFSGRYNGTNGFHYLWIFGLFPFLGSMAGVLFHEFVYKKL
jgi:glycerol uptake facilitator-like aquaporin